MTSFKNKLELNWVNIKNLMLAMIDGCQDTKCPCWPQPTTTLTYEPPGANATSSELQGMLSLTENNRTVTPSLIFLSLLPSPVGQQTTELWHNLQSYLPTAAALSGRCIFSLLCFSLVFPSLIDLPFPWKSSLSLSLSTHPLNSSSLKPHCWIECQACRLSSVCS